MNKFLLLALALAPGAVIGLYIYLKDKYEREPVRLVVLSFFLGFISILITLIISFPISKLVPIDEKDLTEQAIHAFLLVALIEEFSKFIFVRWVLYPSKNFNEPFDGIVYAVSVSLGFAGFENIMYVMNSDNGVATGFMRMFTAVPAHATFAVLMGYYLGRAKCEKGKSYLAWYGLLAATLFHGAYDYFWFVSFVPGLWMGAIASLVIGIVFSRKAIKMHQDASPFISSVASDFRKEENQS
ncbi:MAG TPA: YhfC family glutamic-type intramembrane protease [Cyclobacteriaceae bacterium]|nr:YhfC family glutamic-type intramembrane protease [Cyclobacteriaceae bacterium]